MALQTVNEAVAATPPVAVGGLVFAGMSLNEWVLILTAVYTVILIIKNGPSAILSLYTGVCRLWQKVQQLSNK